MRLKTRLVLGTTVFTTVLTLALFSGFFVELLRGRIQQAADSNEFVARQLLFAARTALERGVYNSDEGRTTSEAELQRNLAGILNEDEALQQTMAGFLLYAPTVQDASLSDAYGKVLTSTDPTFVHAPLPSRQSFLRLTNGSAIEQTRILIGKPQVLDFSIPLRRNGRPFLYAHIGVRSSLLRNVLEPALRQAAFLGLTALLCSLGAAIALSSAALRPIEQISRRLEELSPDPDFEAVTTPHGDTVQRVSSTIQRLDQRIRTSEQQTKLASSLREMLENLSDAVVLFAADGTISLASEGVANFLPNGNEVVVGKSMESVFPKKTVIGTLLQNAFQSGQRIHRQVVTVEGDRYVEASLEFPFARGGTTGREHGAMLRLHNLGVREEIEHEIEISRRLARIGRLSANVGHEVKNPINAMVLHLELLRTKLGLPQDNGAARHLDVLANEMSRLDRVVQTLVDFNRPVEPELTDRKIRPIVNSILQLISAEAEGKNIQLSILDECEGCHAVVDDELLRQALLNIVLNAMEAMPEGGALKLRMWSERQSIAIEVRDNGMGIPANVLDRVFNLYFTTKQTGSGIGLAMTLRIIETMGGTIEVKSDAEPGSLTRGTAFVVRIPTVYRGNVKPSLAEMHA